MAIPTTYPSELPRDLRWWTNSNEVKEIMKGLYMEDDDPTRMVVTAEMKNVFAHYRPKSMEEIWQVGSEVGSEDLCKKCIFFGNFGYGGCADSEVVEANAKSMLTVCVREILNRLNEDSAHYDNYSTAKYLRCLSILFRNISAKHIHDGISEGLLPVVDMDCDEYRKILTIPSDFRIRIPQWFVEQLDRLPADFRQYKMSVSYNDGVGVGIRKQDIVLKDIVGVGTTWVGEGKLRIDFSNGDHQIIDISGLADNNNISVTTAKISANDSDSRYALVDACDSGPRRETPQPKEDEYAYLLRQMFLRDLTEDELEILRRHMGLDGKHPLEMFNCLKEANKKGFLTRSNKMQFGKPSKPQSLSMSPGEIPGTLKAVPVETHAVLNIPEESKKKKEPLIRYSDIGKKFVGKNQGTGYKSKNPNRKHYR